jgi:hypothetical protein
MVDRALVLPPRSQLPPLSSEERRQIIARSPAAAVYGRTIDRESAHELLRKRAEEASASSAQTAATEGKPAEPRSKGREASVWDGFFKSAARSLGTQVGRELIRGVLGSLSGSHRKR